jgi:hypothetical protein
MASDPLTCLIKPVVPCGFWGGVFTGISVYQGLPKQQAFHHFSRNFSFLYIYHALQCPLEAISGKRSCVHNALAGGILGYFGVSKRLIGIPFVRQPFFIQYPQLKPPIIGSLVYGTLAGTLGALSGKPF